MADKDEKLCEPEYHLKETIRKVLEASRCVRGARDEIDKQEKRLKEEHYPEQAKRELELREWMRRKNLTEALFGINETQVIRVSINTNYNTLSWTVMDVRKP